MRDYCGGLKEVGRTLHRLQAVEFLLCKNASRKMDP